MLSLYSVHNFLENPDVNVNKKRRETSTLVRYAPEEAQEFTKHRTRMATLRPNPINSDPSFDAISDVSVPYPSSSPHKETLHSTGTD
ncbi:hypothetical protein PINS_up023754 [Pythium insidiosum]|nr:hypothetical protein PINS_up023754 [Pythium insidiosum]